MKRAESGSWIDTEGAIMARTPGRRNYEISVYQNEVAPLRDYKEGAERDGVPCIIEKFYTHGRLQFRVTVRGVVHVAREILLTRRWIRTRKKQRQIRNFKKAVFEKRKHLSKTIIEARKIAKLF
jgi:hypothetical protein